MSFILFFSIFFICFHKVVSLSFFVDSLAHSSIHSNGSFSNPYKNLSQAILSTMNFFENSTLDDKTPISIFLKYNNENDSSYKFCDFFEMDLKKYGELWLCSYDDTTTYPPEQCDFKKTDKSSIIRFVTEKEVYYNQELLAFIYNGTIGFINVNLEVNFANNKILVIFELYWMNVYFFNCSLNVAEIGKKSVSSPSLKFFSLINSNLSTKCSLLFNNHTKKSEIHDVFVNSDDFICEFVVFFFKYIQTELVFSDSFQIVLDSCVISVLPNIKIIKYITIFEIYGNEKVSIAISNNEFSETQPKYFNLNRDELIPCPLKNLVYEFSVKINGVLQASFANNSIKSYEFNKNCFYKSFRIEVMQATLLTIYNEVYKNMVVYFIFSQIETIFLTKISVSTNGSELQQRKYTDDNYLLLYVKDYCLFLMDTFEVFDYALSKSILIEFEPSEFGNYTLLENVVLDKTSGTIFFLFEPNIYIKTFDFNKSIDIMSCSFTDLSNGGLVFTGLISTSITHILIEQCFFYNMTNNDFQMHMKSLYYLPIPLIFFDSLTANTIKLENLIFMNINGFYGYFINIIIGMTPGTLFLREILISNMNSQDIMSFILIQAPAESKTDIYMFDLFFTNISVKNNIFTVRCLDNPADQNNVTASVIVKNFTIINFQQINNDEMNINQWDLNIYFVFYLYYPKIYFKNIRVIDSKFSFEDHNIVLSSSKLILIDNFLVKNVKIQYQQIKTLMKSGYEGHFIHFIPFASKTISIIITKIVFQNITLEDQNKKRLSLSCGKLYFFILVFNLKNSIINLNDSLFENIRGNCQILNIFSLNSDESQENNYDSKNPLNDNSSKLFIKNSVFKKIKGYFGSVFYCEMGNANFFNNTFEGNLASKGGVFYVGDFCNLLVNSSMFINNLADFGNVFAIDTDYDVKFTNKSKILLANNSFIDFFQNMTFNSSYGLFYFINSNSFIYNCSFQIQEKLNIYWECFSLLNSKSVFNFKFAENITVANETNSSNLTVSSKNFTFYKPLIDVYLEKPLHLFQSKLNLSFAFSFEFSSNLTSIETFLNADKFQHNTYHLINYSSSLLKTTDFSFLSYSNSYEDTSIRCENHRCFAPFIVLNMDECKMGNIFQPHLTPKCDQCSQSYIIPYEADLGRCKPCPVFANCEAGVITPKEGFWRSNNFTDKIYYCSGEINSCLGGYVSECEAGYTGALCKACDNNNGYYLGVSRTCGKCTSGFGLEMFLFWLEFIFFLLIEVYVVYSDSSCLIEHDKNNFGEIQEKYSKKDQLSRLGNILFTFLQILSLLEFFGINLPQEILSFANFLVNPNNGIMYSQYCFSKALGIEMPLVYLNLLIYFFSSVLRLFLLLIIWKFLGRKREKNSLYALEERNTFVNIFPETKVTDAHTFLNDNKNKTNLNYKMLAFIGWFLIENIIILKEVFMLFCVNIDGASYINKDFNYQCDAEYFNLYLPFLIFPILFFYGCLTPLYLYGSVFINRKKLTDPEIMKKFGPLYLAVKHKYFYWPFINYLMKFSIIIVGVFNFADPIKIIFLLVGLIFYSILIYIIQPYIFHSLNRLEIISCWIFIVTLTFSQTQILSNIYVSLKYLNYEQEDFHWISEMGYIVILLLNFGFAGYLTIKILILVSHRVRRYFVKINRYFSRNKDKEKDIQNEFRDSKIISSERNSTQPKNI